MSQPVLGPSAPIGKDEGSGVTTWPHSLRDPHCTDCGAQYGAFHGVDCSYPGTWRESRLALRLKQEGR